MLFMGFYRGWSFEKSLGRVTYSGVLRNRMPDEKFRFAVGTR